MQKGFTLIELLVVITIMSILIGVASVNYQKTVKLGRDSTRKTDIEQIRQALETYRSEIGQYPNTGTNGGLNALVPNYITKLPTDPKGGAYIYRAANSGIVTTYTLCASLEIPSETPPPACTLQTCGGKLCNYGKTNP